MSSERADEAKTNETRLTQARRVGGKLARGLRGSWQVIGVALTHAGQRVSLTRRPSTRESVTALTDAIADADVVSFDLYDTLMARRVDEPEMVHTAVRLLASERGLDVPADWEEVRRQAERVARSRSTRSDIRYDDIYDHVALEPAASAELKDLELELETALLQKTGRGSALYAAAQSSGKRVVVTTDMYLPKHILRHSLRRGGFTGEERLIASGDDGVAKQDGSAFLRLAQEFPAEAVLHIGDNPTKDVKRAEGSGVDGRLLPRPLPPRRGDGAGARPRRPRGQSAVESLQASILRGLHEAHLDLKDDDDRYQDVRAIGYSVLGPLLVGFSTFLDQEARGRGADRLVFLAREGCHRRRESTDAGPKLPRQLCSRPCATIPPTSPRRRGPR